MLCGVQIRQSNLRASLLKQVKRCLVDCFLVLFTLKNGWKRLAILHHHHLCEVGKGLLTPLEVVKMSWQGFGMVLWRFKGRKPCIHLSRSYASHGFISSIRFHYNVGEHTGSHSCRGSSLDYQLLGNWMQPMNVNTKLQGALWGPWSEWWYYMSTEYKSAYWGPWNGCPMRTVKWMVVLDEYAQHWPVWSEVHRLLNLDAVVVLPQSI